MSAVTCETARARLCPYMSAGADNAGVRCIAGDCMAWRDAGTTAVGVEVGYCGAAGPIGNSAEAVTTHLNALTRAVLEAAGELRIVAACSSGRFRR